jgi:antitoxin Phd
MNSWQVQQAKARFREFLNAALEKRPQVVTRRGEETAILVSIEDWRRLQHNFRPNLKSLLLQRAVRIEKLTPNRVHLKRRPAVYFT